MIRPSLRSVAPRAAVALALTGLVGCAGDSALQVPPPTFEQKVGWILRLEDSRVLMDVPAVPAAVDAQARPLALAPSPRPDLLGLVGDPDVQIRRRAALAIGRVGLAEGVPALVSALSDVEPEVRQMAAFGLGLIGDPVATAPLIAALADPSIVVQGRAAQALGSLGRFEAVPAIGETVSLLARQGRVTQILADDVAYPLEPEVEAFRLGVQALARLRAFEPLASAVIAENGQPLVRWWPVAYALQQIADPRSLPALVTFARSGGPGAVLAVRGLSAIGGPEVLTELRSMLDGSSATGDLRVAVVEALAMLRDADATPALLELLRRPDTTPELRLAVVRSLGRLKSSEVSDYLLDLASDRWPPVRAAALDALADIDEQLFVTVLSGIDEDPHWNVRAQLAQTLGKLDPAFGLPRLLAMLADVDQRVVPAVLASLTRLRAPQIETILQQHLDKSDPVVRMAAARGIGDLRIPGGEPWLIRAYERGQSDSSYVARAAALTALAEYSTPEAIGALRRGVLDKDWAVRRQTLTLLEEIGEPVEDAAGSARPGPTRLAAEAYASGSLVNPRVSPHAYVDTSKGTIQIELAVLDAPLTVHNFMTLAREGYYDGLPFHRVVSNAVVQGGDRRGDGEGGPGYTIRDELSEIPMLRGTVAMARDWPDTGGSQFFITRAPQPSLDARYTAFGTVIAGLEVVDALVQWDTIDRIRIWDGTTSP